MFGHGESADFGTRDEFGEETGFLVRSAVEGELVDAELGVGGIGQADATYNARC